MLWTRIAAGVGAALLMSVAAVPTPAAAVDDYLVLSSPQRHAETDLKPGWVTLVFRTKANAELAKILVLDSGGRNVTTGALIVEDTNVTTQLEFDLPKGTYTVLYRTSGEDGRVRGGSFQFAYGKGRWTNEQKEVWIGEAEEPPVLTNPDPNATGAPTATPTPTVEPSASATPSAPVTPPTGSASASPAPVPGDSSGAIGWIIGGGVLLLGAAGAGGWYAWRRRTQT